MWMLPWADGCWQAAASAVGDVAASSSVHSLSAVGVASSSVPSDMRARSAMQFMKWGRRSPLVQHTIPGCAGTFKIQDRHIRSAAQRILHSFCRKPSLHVHGQADSVGTAAAPLSDCYVLPYHALAYSLDPVSLTRTSATPSVPFFSHPHLRFPPFLIFFFSPPKAVAAPAVPRPIVPRARPAANLPLSPIDAHVTEPVSSIDRPSPIPASDLNWFPWPSATGSFICGAFWISSPPSPRNSRPCPSHLAAPPPPQTSRVPPRYSSHRIVSAQARRRASLRSFAHDQLASPPLPTACSSSSSSSYSPPLPLYLQPARSLLFSVFAFVLKHASAFVFMLGRPPVLVLVLVWLLPPPFPSLLPDSRPLLVGPSPVHSAPSSCSLRDLDALSDARTYPYMQQILSSLARRARRLPSSAYLFASLPPTYPDEDGRVLASAFASVPCLMTDGIRRARAHAPTRSYSRPLRPLFSPFPSLAIFLPSSLLFSTLSRHHLLAPAYTYPQTHPVPHTRAPSSLPLVLHSRHPRARPGTSYLSTLFLALPPATPCKTAPPSSSSYSLPPAHRRCIASLPPTHSRRGRIRIFVSVPCLTTDDWRACKTARTPQFICVLAVVLPPTIRIRLTAPPFLSRRRPRPLLPPSPPRALVHFRLPRLSSSIVLAFSPPRLGLPDSSARSSASAFWLVLAFRSVSPLVHMQARPHSSKSAACARCVGAPRRFSPPALVLPARTRVFFSSDSSPP
ncbi:hypothetical protein C8R47DRAFT_1286575 [Mycena vitilis]|nr:hypothetical protein C8R47DRAFT_1286575 [Mycena vitilis]